MGHAFVVHIDKHSAVILILQPLDRIGYGLVGVLRAGGFILILSQELQFPLH